MVRDPSGGLSGKIETALDPNPCRAKDGDNKLVVQKHKRHRVLVIFYIEK
jgi:hypothetical protein